MLTIQLWTVYYLYYLQHYPYLHYIALIISYINNDNEVDENHYQLSH